MNEKWENESKHQDQERRTQSMKICHLYSPILWKSNDTKFFFIAVNICWQKKFALQSWGEFSSYDFSGCRHFAIVLFCKQRMWRKRVIRVKSFVFPQLFPWQSFLLRKWKPHSWSSVSYISIDQLQQALTSPRSGAGSGREASSSPSSSIYLF